MRQSAGQGTQAAARPSHSPAARLVDALGHKVGGEAVVKQLLVLKGVVQLRRRETAGRQVRDAAAR